MAHSNCSLNSTPCFTFILYNHLGTRHEWGSCNLSSCTGTAQSRVKALNGAILGSSSAMTIFGALGWRGRRQDVPASLPVRGEACANVDQNLTQSRQVNEVDRAVAQLQLQLSGLVCLTYFSDIREPCNQQLVSCYLASLALQSNWAAAEVRREACNDKKKSMTVYGWPRYRPAVRLFVY